VAGPRPPAGHDPLTRCTVSHQDVHGRDWNTEVDACMRQLVEHQAAYGSHPTYGHGDPYAGGQSHDGHHGYNEHHHHDGHPSGPGIGTAVAAGAAGLAVGVVGGMVAAEAVDEIGDFFEGDQEDEG